MPRHRLPKLPQLLDRKIYKSGQTRGADDDEIFQNRVGRNGTALIRFSLWDGIRNSVGDPAAFFDNGYIVLISPDEYFSLSNPSSSLEDHGLQLGTNALIFYQRRSEWDQYNPNELGWSPATSRQPPLGGQFVARIHATTASEGGDRISLGFTTTGMKGAGIRVYEYAPKATIDACRLQLEAVYWLCHNSVDAVCEFDMTREDAVERRTACLQAARDAGLLDYRRLVKSRIINNDHVSVCPLCLSPLDAFGFFNRKAQAAGREKYDLTITELNLFHIHELRPGEFNHKPYNLGWGHHLCNVVIGDEGIDRTIDWMRAVVARNDQLDLT